LELYFKIASIVDSENKFNLKLTIT